MSAIWLIWVITSIETYLPWNCMLVVNAVKGYNLRTHYYFDIFGFLVSHSMTSTPSSCKYLVFQLENDFDLCHYHFGFGTKWPERELLWVCRFSLCINLINNGSSLVTHLLVNKFFSYNDSSQVAVKPAIDLSGSVPPIYSLLHPIQLLYNNHGPFKINFKPIDNENVYNSLRDFSLRLSKLPYYLERNGT
jgi:hypothetical protein